MSDTRVIVALDFADAGQAWALCEKLSPTHCKIKIGKELFTRAGPDFVKRVVDAGFDVFLDLKYHDIPNTVANACRVAADLGVWMLNVHAIGGAMMLEAARQAIDTSSHKPLLIAVTVLTSLSNDDLAHVGMAKKLNEQVVLLAKLAKSSGLDGVVCSAQEAEQLRTHLGKEFCLVTPGIRLQDSGSNDQRRITTPRTAILAGSDYLVIGRPITQAADPIKVLDEINTEIAQALRSESGLAL